VLTGIAQARTEIARVKAILRAAGAAAVDHPDDVAHERWAPAAASAPLTPEERENRRAMLDKVRLTWIEGVVHRTIMAGPHPGLVAWNRPLQRLL
jgi:hypothetical protein